MRHLEHRRRDLQLGPVHLGKWKQPVELPEPDGSDLADLDRNGQRLDFDLRERIVAGRFRRFRGDHDLNRLVRQYGPGWVQQCEHAVLDHGQRLQWRLLADEQLDIDERDGLSCCGNGPIPAGSGVSSRMPFGSPPLRCARVSFTLDDKTALL
jgi:hypothetical protein